KPTISVSPSATTLCSGKTVNLVGSGTSVSYTWSPATFLDATTGASVTSSPVNAGPDITTTYTLTGTSALGCTNATTATVTVQPLPNITINPANAVCLGGTSVVLTANGGTSSGYTWSPNLFLSSTNSATVTAQIS